MSAIASSHLQAVARSHLQDLQIMDGVTPLHLAAGNGHEAVTKQLIQARCNVNLQEDENGGMALHVAAFHGRATVTKQLLTARCNVDLQANDDATAPQAAELEGHTGIATLIRKQKHKSAERGKKDTLLQASPVQIKKQKEDADRAMKELLEEEDKESKYDFSTLEEDEYQTFGGRHSQAPLMPPPMQAPKKMLNIGASEFVPSLGGFAEDSSGTGRMEGDNDLEVDVERNMENDTAEDSLPGDMPDEQWLRTNSDIGAENLIWYTDQVRKWYRHAVYSLKIQKYALSHMNYQTTDYLCNCRSGGENGTELLPAH